MTRSRKLRTKLPADLSTQASRIRHARLSCGYSQAQLAQLISDVTGKATSKPTVSKWESGKTTNPEIDTFHSLSRVTGFSAYWLNTGAGEMKASRTSEHELNILALGAAVRSYFPALTESQAEGIRTIYQILVTAPQLDKKALKEIQQALEANKTAI